MDFKTFALVADPHGDQIHRPAANLFFEWLKEAKPQIRVHLGDNWNFDALRSGASANDKTVDLKKDVRAGLDFLDQYFDGAEEKIFLRGNHDERLWNLLRDRTNALARDYAREMTQKIEEHVSNLGIQMLPYHARKGVYRLGKLKCVHGYAHGKTASRTHARSYGDCVFGHVHRFDTCNEDSFDGPRIGRSIGCLAKHDMSYCSTSLHPLGWHHGWAYGVVYSNGDFQIFNAQIQNNHVVAATSFKAF